MSAWKRQICSQISIWNSEERFVQCEVISKKMVFALVIYCSKRDYPENSLFFELTILWVRNPRLSQLGNSFCSTWCHLRSIILWCSAATAGKAMIQETKGVNGDEVQALKLPIFRDQ